MLSRPGLFASILMLLITPAWTAAQPQGLVSGVVEGYFDAPVPEASITLTSPSGYQVSDATDPDGRFLIGPLVTGRYRMQVQARGLPVRRTQRPGGSRHHRPGDNRPRPPSTSQCSPGRCTTPKASPCRAPSSKQPDRPRKSERRSPTRPADSASLRSVPDRGRSSPVSTVSYQRAGTTEVVFGQTADATVVLPLDYGVAETVVVVGVPPGRSAAFGHRVGGTRRRAVGRGPEPTAELRHRGGPADSGPLIQRQHAANLGRRNRRQTDEPPEPGPRPLPVSRQRQAPAPRCGDRMARQRHRRRLAGPGHLRRSRDRRAPDRAPPRRRGGAVRLRRHRRRRQRATQGRTRGRNLRDPVGNLPGRQRRRPRNLRSDGLLRSHRQPRVGALGGRQRRPANRQCRVREPQPRVRRGRTDEPGGPAP